MAGKKNLPVILRPANHACVGLIGVFLTSNMILFYFCWELMLVPAYFIVGEWGYRNSYKSALKLFIFTHAGAVFVLLGHRSNLLVNRLHRHVCSTSSLNDCCSRHRQMDSNRLNRWIRSKNGSVPSSYVAPRCTLRSTSTNVRTTQRCHHQRRSLRNHTLILRHGFPSCRHRISEQTSSMYYQSLV